MLRPDPQTPLFLYGTMLDMEILELVLGRSVSAGELMAARLEGFRRVKVPDESYPVLVAANESGIGGAVISKLSASDWDRVIFFENVEYEHRECVVQLDDGTELIAVFYSDGVMVPGADDEWTLEWWQEVHKPHLMPAICEYMTLFGKASFEEADAAWETLTGEK